MVKRYSIVLIVLALGILFASCSRKHECATRKGKKKKEFYYGLQFK
jgi:hypothetical protein